MKLVRYGRPGKEKPGLIDAAGRIRDLSEVVADIDGATLAPRVSRASPRSSRKACRRRAARRGSVPA